MHKILSIAAGAALFASGASVAFAQPSYGSCVSIPAGLSQGSSGSSVLALQRFLVAQNYPGGGSWMETGYYGAATAAAVRDFQLAQNVPQTGTIDAATASAIASASCGGSGYAPFGGSLGSLSYAPQTYPYYSYPSATYPGYPGYAGGSYSYPMQYPSQYYPSYYGTAPAITSLSQNTGAPGASVTVYGAGFDPYNNTVNFGGTFLYNVSSQNGTSLTFTVPATSYLSSPSGTQVQLSVSSSRGTSNSVSFTVYSYGYGGYGCGTYPYYYSCGCNTYPYSYNNYNYNYNDLSCPPPGNTTQPVIYYLYPASGGVGTSVTVYGSGFTASGNTVHFGAGVIAGLVSPDGRSVSFIVPSTLTGYGTSPLVLSTYQVSVTNGLGYTSNSMPFTVTSTTGNASAPVISSVTGPNSLATGQQGTWTVNVSAGSGQYLSFSVNWGDQILYPYAAQSAQTVYQTNTLTHTYEAAGTYTIAFTVSNSYGQSNTYTTTVAVSGINQSGAPSISYISPQSGRVGTTVTIVGSGFAYTGNTVHFGIGGSLNVPSSGGTLISYVIPYSVSSCDLVSGYGCGGAQPPAVSPGQYQIYVANGSGSSNLVTFTVTF